MSGRKNGKIVVSEIYPGHGRCNFNISNDGFDDRSDEEVIKGIYADIGYDILRWNPERLKEEDPDAEKVDLEKEGEDNQHEGCR